MAPFVLYVITVLISQLVFGLPPMVLDGHAVLLTAIGLLSVAAGNCTLAALLTTKRGRKMIAVLAVPVVFALFIVGMNLAYHLYASSTIESFDYISTIDDRAQDEDFDGEYYYDAEKNVMVLEGTEYEPETIANPEHFTGWKQAGSYVFELLDPYAGNELCMVETIMDDTQIPLWVMIAYIVKAVMWGAISFGFMKRRCTSCAVK